MGVILPFPSRADFTAAAFPPGEGGRAQRGRMRFVPLQYAEPAVFPDFPLRLGSAGIPRFLCSWVSCFVNPVDLRKARGRLRLWARGLRRPGANAAPAPRKGHRPLTLFRWRDPLQLREPAVLGAGGACSAFPSGEGGRAQRGRMRFVPLHYAEPAVSSAFLCGWAVQGYRFPLRLGELFRESGGFTKGAWGFAPAGAGPPAARG